MNPSVIGGAGTDWAAACGKHGHPVLRLLIDQGPQPMRFGEQGLCVPLNNYVACPT